MRKYLAATAVLSSALILAACSDGSGTSDETATPSATATATATETSSAVYDTVGACRAYFYGEGSLDSYVQAAAPSIANPLDDTTTGTVTSASQRLGAILPLVDDESAVYLEAIKAPFDQALEGTTGDPAAVTAAVDEYSDACETAGYAG
ncbi:hypothetical protein L1785_06455 [Antribacter sp. KLBMP9083]|uniref:Lipoprotein n=1 Tax=Antribacter soli TaxID=2910976 RepID=A0AA41U625_9MICO|nr:hypothetical protein [Antribacter soli]MCF4120613.1 hypothetical protein [Antribacter soli]